MKRSAFLASLLLMLLCGCGHSKPKAESTSFKNDLRDTDSPKWNKK
jgi:hypothetical protein